MPAGVLDGLPAAGFSTSYVQAREAIELPADSEQSTLTRIYKGARGEILSVASGGGWAVVAFEPGSVTTYSRDCAGPVVTVRLGQIEPQGS